MLLYFTIIASLTWRHLIVYFGSQAFYSIIAGLIFKESFISFTPIAAVFIFDVALYLLSLYVGVKMCWLWDNHASQKLLDSMGFYGIVSEEVILTAYALKDNYKKIKPSNESILLQAADAYLRKLGLSADAAAKQAQHLLASAYSSSITIGDKVLYYNSGTNITRRNAFQETLVDLAMQLEVYTILTSSSPYNEWIVHSLISNRKRIQRLAKLISVTKRNYYRYKTPKQISNLLNTNIDILDPSSFPAAVGIDFNDVLTMYIFDARLRRGCVRKTVFVVISLMIFLTGANYLQIMENSYEIEIGNQVRKANYQYTQGYDEGYDQGVYDGYIEGYLEGIGYTD